MAEVPRPGWRFTVAHTAHRFDQMISFALLLMMGMVVLSSTFDMAVVLMRDILSPPVFLLSADELLEVFSVFLNVLIALELIETVRLHFTEGTVRADNVILIAMTAMLRKLILLDPKQTSGMMVLGVAAIVLGLGISFYLVKRADKRP